MHTQVRKGWNPIPFRVWIAWMGLSLSATVGVVIFLYQNFETKDSFDQYKQEQLRFEDELIRRLDRIENKLDQSNHK